MRRALLILLAVPASALAQTAGVIVRPTGVTTINIAQCKGTNSGQEPPLSDDMSYDLTWTVATTSSSVIADGDLFRLYASSVQPAAGQTVSSTVRSSCTEDTSLNTIASDKIAQVGSDIAATSTTQSTPESFGTAAIASAAGNNCTDTTSVPVYLCVQWLSSASEVKGYAIATLTLDRTVPGTPTLSSASPGDSVLHLSCSGGTNATSFKGKATSQANAAEVHYSGTATSCSDVTISGLTNDQPYDVVVFGIDAANNPSVASNQVTGTPIKTDDFWQHYQGDGGREQGGCSTAAGAAGILGALSLLALRRRKP
jgi:hypothetical protein